MPRKLDWTPPRDAVLCRLRAEGESWDAIAACLFVSRNAAIERGRRLGARLPQPPARPVPPDPNRDPLPAGSEASWGALLAGTVLEGNEYEWLDPLGTAAPRRPAIAAPVPTERAVVRLRACATLRDAARPHDAGLSPAAPGA